jgi:hypothetical protein
MAKPIIVTRAGKGSALTWVEGDANFTNLQDATIVVSDGTNSKAIDLNSTIQFTAGLNITLGVDPLTGIVTIANTSLTATVLQEYVMNQTGVTIPKGSVVYISGANGTNPLITLSQANTEMGSSKTLGFTTTAITQGSTGYVITNGLLQGVNTDTANIGDPVWLSSTTAGGMVFGVANRPIPPNHAVFLGVVVRVNQNNGAIVVKVQNGYELYELHNVSNATPNDNDVLKYVASTGLWTPAVGGSGGGITDIVNDTTPQLGGNLDLNSFKLTQTSGNFWIEGSLNNNIELFGFGTGNIKFSPTVNGFVYIDGQKFPKGTATSGQVLTSDGAGTLSWTTPSSGGGGTSGLETNFLLMGA